MESLIYYSKLIKTHLYYIFNKKNLTVITLVNILLFILLLIDSNIFKRMSNLDANRREYFYNFVTNYFIILRILLISFIIFLTIGYFLKEYNSYQELLIKSIKTKISFYITKYLSIILLYFLEVFMAFIEFEFVLLIVPYGRMHALFIKSFFNLFLTGVFYIFLSSILILLLSTYFGALISIIIYMISFIYTNFYEIKDSIKSFIIMAIPNGGNEYLLLDYSLVFLLIYILILAIINAIIIIKKDGL